VHIFELMQAPQTNVIEDDVDLSNTVIKDPLIVDGVTFRGKVFFEGTFFHGDVLFTNCVFEGPVLLRGAHVPERLQFKKCVFRSLFSLAAGQSKPGGRAKATEEITLRHVNFHESAFHGYTTFNNREFTRSPDFSETRFFRPPQFQNAIVHPGIKLDGAEFAVPTGATEDELRDAVRAFRRLRTIAQEIGAVDRYNEFLARELQTRRISASTSFTEKLVIGAYWLISDYGRSISRPPIFLVVLTAILALIGSVLCGISNLPAMLGFLVSQSFVPFGALASDFLPPGALAAGFAQWGLALRAISAAQSLLTLTTVALFLFALRRRFHLS